MPDPIPEHRKRYPHSKAKLPAEPPKTTHQFSYMLKPDTVAELKSRGIEFVTVDCGAGRFGNEGRYWPAFKLPSGRLILLSMDDEGNGRGSIIEADAS